MLRNGRPEVVPVVTGLSDGTVTEVLRGLEVGDLVITDVTISGKPAGSGGAPGGSPPRMGRMF